ncbi:DUF3784 domain-containing protein [Psychroserpens damuponensis]|uniref:DUF3784 domain-containing protein n=1 Tax=Psychroserpens damuponensis TaxID=943936 RepID=UPI00058CA172|nr:DUF3784 domain-containing protein [Psychroserpens damuponensis]
MSLSVAIIFIILGVLIKNFKLYFLIAGYNTMSKTNQEKYDINGIATVFRNTMFGMAILMIIGYAISYWLELPKIEIYLFFGAIVIGIPYLLIVSNSSKYKIDKR